jgi:hypothetical protein
MQSLLCGSLSQRHDASSGCGRRIRPPDIEGSCEYTKCGQPTGGAPPALRLGEGLTTLHRKKGQPVRKCYKGPRTWTDCDHIKEDEMDGTGSTHGRDKKCTQHFGRKT